METPQGLTPSVPTSVQRHREPAEQDETGPAYLCSAFGLGTLAAARQVARGAMGAVWRVDVRGSGSAVVSYAAKHLFWEIPAEEDVTAEVDFTELCRRAGVSSPSAIPTPAGHYLVYDAAGQAWRLYEWAEGSIPDRADRHTARWLAIQLARIHALGQAPSDGTTGHPFYQRVDVDWEALTAGAAAASVDWASALKDAQPRLDALSNLVNTAPDERFVMCHRDPKNSNVLVDSAGARWLVDWDNCGAMSPVRELGLLLIHHVGDLEAVAAIAASYREHGGPARVNGVENFATGLAAWLNFFGGQAGMILDPDVHPDHRRFAAQQVLGLIRNMPTVQQLERAAAAAVHRR